MAERLKALIRSLFPGGNEPVSQPSLEASIRADVNRRLGYYQEEEANAAIVKVRAHTMLPYVRLVTLYQQVVHCERLGIRGAFVECGVWKAGAVGLMALANLSHGRERRLLHLFDAFDDICEPDPDRDGKRALDETRRFAGEKEPLSGRLRPLKGIYDPFGGHGTLPECRRLLVETLRYPAESIRFHPGWFQDTLPEAASTVGAIALLRLDGDWYASTKICLDHLYDRVAPGGFVIVDDYGYYDGCRQAVDDFRAERAIGTFLTQVDFGCVYWIKSGSEKERCA